MKPYYEKNGIVIYHGDCRDVLTGLNADVMVTDPPYGMAFESSRGGQFGKSHIANDETTGARDEALRLWAGRPALVFGRWSVPRPVGTRMVLTWDKGEHVGMGDLALPWKPNTEEIYVLGKGFSGPRTGSVIHCLAIAGTVAVTAGRSHPTEKPVSLLSALIAKCPAGVVVDPFVGSGSTLVAAKSRGRKAIGIELEERYCEIAAQRLSQEVLDLEVA